MATSRLSASAKPFAFNPNAKSFVFASQATPAAVTAPPPPPPPPQPKAYSTDELFALRPPLYCGCNLVLSMELDLSEILHYDPCFDYVSCGLITVVPTQPAEADAEADADDQAAGDANPDAGLQGEEAMYDMVMSPGATFNSSHTQPAKRMTKKSKKAARGGSSAIAAGTTAPPSDPHDGATADTTGAEMQAAVAAEGVASPADSDGEDESAADGSDDADDGDSDEEGEGAEGEDSASRPLPQLHHPPLPQQYMWTPQAYGYVPGAADVSGMQQADYYYAAAASYPSASALSREDTSFHANRRRHTQSQYFSHFSHNNNHTHGSYSHSSRFGGGSNRGGTYSPPLMAQRRDLYFQQDLHLHMSDHYYTREQQRSDRERKTYNRDTLLEMRTAQACTERPEHLPTHLSDIYKAVPGGSRSPTRTGRSLFGNTAAAGASPGPGSGAARSVFGGGSLQPNTNHSLPVPDSPSGGGLAGGSGGAGMDGLPPKRPGKLKAKRKKNKDRCARAIDDDLITAQMGGRSGAAVSSRLAGRPRLDSVDRNDDMDERKGEEGPSFADKMRGLSTPKHKPIKQKKGKAKKGQQQGLESPRKGSLNGHGKRGGGNGNGGPGSFQLDEFENATLADLHHCENKWMPSVVQGLTIQSASDSLRVAEKSVRSILNKLSIDKLPALLQSMLAIGIESSEVLQVVVDVLFDKSVDEPEFAGLYAKFCAALAPHMPEFTVHTGAPPATQRTIEGTNTSSKVYSFRTMLLTRCYKLLVEDEESLRQSLHATALANARAKEFSLSGGGSGTGSPRLASRTGSPSRVGGSPRTVSPRLLSASTSPLIGASSTPLELPLVTSLELSEKLHLLQVHQRGNLIFIGELYKQGMIATPVVHLCLDMLLDGSEGAVDEPSEWDVECVCIFLKCVGLKLDASANGTDPDEVVEGEPQADGGESLRATRRQLLDSHFRKVTALSRCATLPSRFRFMLQDLLELRARGWVPRMQKTVDPKSLTEIREQNAAAAALATPQRGHWNGGAAATTMKKGAKPFAGGGGGGAHMMQQAGLRTTVKPQGGGLGMRPAPAAGPAPMAFQGRTLQFGASPPFKRSISAPDRNDMLASGHGGGGLQFSPLPPINASNQATPSSNGRYVPVWKRRQMGIDEHTHGLLPRSGAQSPTPRDDGGADAGAGADADADADAHAVTNPSFDLAGADGDGEEGAEGGAECADAHSSEQHASALSDDTMQRHLATILDELYSSHDVPEALQCLAELEPQCASSESMQRALVPLLLSKCVEQSSASSRDLCTPLLHALADDDRLSTDSLLRGLDEWALLLVDVSIDIPHAPAYSHSVMASLLRHGRLHFQQLLLLYARAIQEGSLEPDQAAAWAIDTLVQLRVLCESEATMLELLTPLAAEEAKPASLTALFSGDAQAAKRALDAHNLSSCKGLL